MEVRDNEGQISQNDILHMKFSEFWLCIHNNCEYTPVTCQISQLLWNLTFIISDFHDKFSLVLLQMIYYILSPWKM